MKYWTWWVGYANTSVVSLRDGYAGHVQASRYIVGSSLFF